MLTFQRPGEGFESGSGFAHPVYSLVRAQACSASGRWSIRRCVVINPTGADQRLLTGHRGDCFGERPGAVHAEQHAVGNVQAPIGELAHMRITSALFSVVPSITANGTLVPSAVTPNAATSRLITEREPVEEHGQPPFGIEAESHHGSKLLCRGRDQPARH